MNSFRGKIGRPRGKESNDYITHSPTRHKIAKSRLKGIEKKVQSFCKMTRRRVIILVQHDDKHCHDEIMKGGSNMCDILTAVNDDDTIMSREILQEMTLMFNQSYKCEMEKVHEDVNSINVLYDTETCGETLETNNESRVLDWVDDDENSNDFHDDISAMTAMDVQNFLETI